jgi:hypothetical protein
VSSDHLYITWNIMLIINKIGSCLLITYIVYEITCRKYLKKKIVSIYHLHSVWNILLRITKMSDKNIYGFKRTNSNKLVLSAMRRVAIRLKEWWFNIFFYSYRSKTLSGFNHSLFGLCWLLISPLQNGWKLQVIIRILSTAVFNKRGNVGIR